MADTIFPVVYSVLASSALISQVLNQYDIGTVTSCQFWHRGLSDIYIVETQAKQYVLRVSHVHWRSRSDIDFELELLDFLRQNYIPVAYPLRTKTGQLAIAINALEGQRYAALFIYAPGNVAIGDLNVTQSFSLGETVAKLHQTTQNFTTQAQRQQLTLDYLLHDSFQAIKPFLHQRSPDLAYFTEVVNQLHLQLRHFPIEPPLWGICWGDPHSGNVHFTPEQQLTLFDFDQCGYGWRIFEIAKFLQVGLHSGLSAKVREAFISGYQTVAPLMEDELSSLQAFTQVAHIWAWAICLNNTKLYDYSRLDDSYFHSRIAHLKMLRSPEWQLF
ncbi:homoserine kinase [Pantanalinema sp. GBBB05]|uniref:homoserine kinase n=1 Tax=Pantanalinema sp. GBBB05 TaxID=2604139 RepID=UPI001DA6F3CB|nr:phosphotransferase [Pantanalinema sp. GBBB05]